MIRAKFVFSRLSVLSSSKVNCLRGVMCLIRSKRGVLSDMFWFKDAGLVRMGV